MARGDRHSRTAAAGRPRPRASPRCRRVAVLPGYDLPAPAGPAPRGEPLAAVDAGTSLAGVVGGLRDAWRRARRDRRAPSRAGAGGPRAPDDPPRRRAATTCARLDALAARDTPLAPRLMPAPSSWPRSPSSSRWCRSIATPWPRCCRSALYPIVLAAWAGCRRACAAQARARVALRAHGRRLQSVDRPRADAGAGGVAISVGWVSFASILLRFALTVSAALLLVAGTGMHPLCAALGRLGVPRVFTVQLLFLHRYIFVLAGEADAHGHRARAARRRARAHALAVYASLLGHLLLRAFERARRIHLAMLARGFDGELRRADRSPGGARHASSSAAGSRCSCGARGRPPLRARAPAHGRRRQ